MNTYPKILFTAVPALVFGSPAFGITIQDASTASYVTGNSSYDGVVQISFDESNGVYLCSGALIAPTVILTAGHCVNGGSNWTITFQTPSGNTNISAAATYLDPQFTPYPSDSALAGLDEYDVGIIELSQAAPSDATIYGIDTSFSGITFGSTPVDIVGYGLGGNPTVGILSYGTRRAAQQVIQGTLGSLNGVVTPDDPIYMTMTYSATTPPGYGLINGGDSGGPALFGNEIIGIADFGDQPETGNYENNVEYLIGEENLANPAISGFVDGFLVPEPGTSCLIGGGLLLLTGLRRRAAKRTAQLPS